MHSNQPHELLVIIEIQELVTCCGSKDTDGKMIGRPGTQVNQQISDLLKRAKKAGYEHHDMNDGFSRWNNTGIMSNGDCVFIDLGGFRKLRPRRRLTTEDKLGLNGASRKIVAELRRLAKKDKKPNATSTTNLSCQ